ncbi:hypothetical protein KCP70_11980 [Salmonella enterica subsp. enterica]|nr:hypothetical protein KCP70_11980 [Salmonella enterica subsp. enterica]
MIIAHLHQETCFANHFRFTYHARMTLCNIVICFAFFAFTSAVSRTGMSAGEPPHQCLSTARQRRGTSPARRRNNLCCRRVISKRLRRLPNSLINPATQGLELDSTAPS